MKRRKNKSLRMGKLGTAVLVLLYITLLICSIEILYPVAEKFVVNSSQEIAETSVEAKAQAEPVIEKETELPKEKETEAPRTEWQTLYFLYAALPDGKIATDVRRDKGFDILVSFTDEAMELQYGFADDDCTPMKFLLLSDGTYSRYDSFLKEWQERVVVKPGEGRIYFIKKINRKDRILVYGIDKEDYGKIEEGGDKTAQSFYKISK